MARPLEVVRKEAAHALAAGALAPWGITDEELAMLVLEQVQLGRPHPEFGVGWHEYDASRKVYLHALDAGWGFYAQLMACIRRADTENMRRFKQAFPDVVGELQARYNAVGGLLPTDEQSLRDEVMREARGGT